MKLKTTLSFQTATLLAAALLVTPAWGGPACESCPGEQAPTTQVLALEDGADDEPDYAAIDAAVEEAVPGIEIEDGEEVMPGVYAVFGEAEEDRFYFVLVTEEGRVLGVEEEVWDEDEDWDEEDEGWDEEEHEDEDWDEEDWSEEDEAAWAAELEAMVAELPEEVRESIDGLIGEGEEIVEVEEVMEGVFIIVGEGEEGIGIAMILANGEVVSTDYMTHEEMEEWEDMDDEDWDEEDMEDGEEF